MSEKKTRKPRAKKPTEAVATRDVFNLAVSQAPGEAGELFSELQAERPALAIERIARAWKQDLLDDEEARVDYILKSVEDIAGELLPIIARREVERRYGRENFTKAVEDSVHIEEAVERWKQTVRESLHSSDKRSEAWKLASDIDQNASNLLLLKLMEEASDRHAGRKGEAKGTVKLLDSNIFREQTRQQHGSYLRQSIVQYALQLARQNVEQRLKSAGDIVEVSRRLLLLPTTQRGTLRIATSKFVLGMNRGIMSPVSEVLTHDASEVRNGKTIERRIRTGVEVYARDREQILERMIKEFQ
jgi:hypothetical protein